VAPVPQPRLTARKQFGFQNGASAVFWKDPESGLQCAFPAFVVCEPEEVRRLAAWLGRVAAWLVA